MTTKLTLSDHIALNGHHEIYPKVVSALKRTFSRSPIAVEFLAKHRREEVWIKKDGTIARHPKVFYRCFACNEEFRSTAVQIDHIEPVVPVNIPARHLSVDTLISRLFCDESKLQILCKEHHAEKSARENAERAAWNEKLKFIVYETVNSINRKKYIGVHRCYDYDDVYLGSGVLLKKALKKYGSAAFYRHILFVYDNADEAYEKEHELVNDDVVFSDSFYNVATGGCTRNHGGISTNGIKVICHQTGEVFQSIRDAARFVGRDESAISRVLNKPNQPVCNFHFFALDEYDDKVAVTFPTVGRSVVHLNSKRAFSSLACAAEALGLNYKSLRNAMRDPDENGVCGLAQECFVYTDSFDAQRKYTKIVKKIELVEKQLLFDSGADAGRFLKKERPVTAGIAISRAARSEGKMYGFHWRIREETVVLHDGEEIRTEADSNECFNPKAEAS